MSKINKSDSNGTLIYTRRSGSNKNHPKEKSGGKKKAKMILIIIAVLVLAGALVYIGIARQRSGYSGENVVLEISGTETNASGAAVEYKVHYANNEKIDLRNLEFVMQYSSGFSFDEAEPPSPVFSDDVWQVEELAAGSSGDIIIKGKLFGEKDESKTIKVKLQYSPKDVSSTFSLEREFITTVTEAALAVAVEAPSQTVKGAEMSFTVSVKNLMAEKLNNVRLELSYPEIFEFKSAEPAATLEQNIFNFVTLEAQSEQKVTVKGILTSETEKNGAFSATAKLKETGGDYVTQATADFTTAFVSPSFKLTETVNGGDKINSAPGEKLEYKVKYKNEGDVDLKNVALTHEFNDTDLLDSSTFSSDQGTYSEGKVTFTLAEIIKSQTEGEITFTINLVNELPKTSGSSGYQLTGKTKVTAGTIGDSSLTIAAESAEMVVSISASVSLTAEGHYYDYEGIVVGSGPIPLKEGFKTIYRVYWFVDSPLGSLQETKVSTVLPSYIKFEGTVASEQGEITYTEYSREVIWTIGNISATGADKVEASFKISVIPTFSDIGKVILILNGSKVTAKDTVSKKEISDTDGSIDTNLPDDIYATDDGAVVESAPVLD